jgi:hypothetical protein
MFSLEIKGTPQEHGNIVELDTYTFDNGAHFPKSYRDFAKELGYGLLMDRFLIYIPMGEYGDSWNVRTEEIRDTYIDDVEQDVFGEFDYEPDGSKELMLSWVPFASSENGDYLFWDMREEHDGEFDIYITDFRSGTIKAAKDLYELIDKLGDPQKFKQVLPYSEKPLPKVFKPLKKIKG